MNANKHNSTAVFRLTALWGLNEAGLGGWMHALNLPFTGFFVGGFAVVLIALIAWYSGGSMRVILQSTLLVVLVKAAVSPQSPPPAYLAVAFQGAAGAMLFRLLPSFSLASVLFCIIAMLESALQKLIIATLLFGNALWEAIGRFFQDILKETHIPALSFSFWVIGLYCGVYAIWGLVLGLWVKDLPQRIETRKRGIMAELKTLQETGKGPDSEPLPKKQQRWMRFLLVGALLLFTVVILVMNRSVGQAAYVLLRTVAVLLFFIGLVSPFVRWLMRRQGSRRQSEMADIISMFPELRSYLRPALSLARRRSGFARYSCFLLVLIVLTLHPDIYEA